MSGDKIYSNYYGAYNDGVQNQLPIFTDEEDFVSHTEAVSLEKIETITLCCTFSPFMSCRYCIAFYST